MQRRSEAAVAAAVVATLIGGAVASRADAQPLGRLRGRVVTTMESPASEASVRIEALYGFLGGDYSGQKTFSLRTDAKGEWALIGFKAGVWVFEASAPGQLPDVIALPINVSLPPSSGVGGDAPSWHPLLRLVQVPSTPEGEVLKQAAEAALAGQAQAVATALARVADSSDQTVLVAAGRICLVLRDAATARPFFRRALDRAPESFAAAIGLASTALMQKNFDVAGREYGAARDRTKDKEERSYLTAAIADVNKIHIRP